MIHLRKSAVRRGKRPADAGGSYPAWRVGASPGDVIVLNAALLGQGTASMSGTEMWPPPYLDGSGTSAHIINAWGSCARIGNIWYAHGGGHGDWQNSVAKINLGADVPTWVQADQGSVVAPEGWTASYSAGGVGDDTKTPNMTDAYYGDGRPASIHTYYSLHSITAAQAHDGHPGLLRVPDGAPFGAGSEGWGGTYHGTPPTFNRWRSDTETWELNGGVFPDFIASFGGSTEIAVCQDWATGDLYVDTGYTLYKWDASENSWGGSYWVRYDTIDPFTSSHPNGLGAFIGWPTLIDNLRNSFVGLPQPLAGIDGAIDRIQLVNLSSPAVVTHTLTGLPTGYEGGMVHDLDNDLYLFVPRGRTLETVPIYSIDPNNSWAVATVATGLPSSYTPDDGYSTYSAGVYNRLEYFPDLHGVAYLGRYEDDIRFIVTG